jgi:hypothetical protein
MIHIAIYDGLTLIYEGFDPRRFAPRRYRCICLLTVHSHNFVRLCVVWSSGRARGLTSQLITIRMMTRMINQ